MYFRLSDAGHALSTQPSWYASGEPTEPTAGIVSRTLHSAGGQMPMYGPMQGDMALPQFALVGGEPHDINTGDRDAGIGRNWERLHLIGVSAGHLLNRRYSNYNTVIGSHALNTAMIPFERIVNWVQSEGRQFYYHVNIDRQVPLTFIDRNGLARHEHVAFELRQSISYTSAYNDTIWITIEQRHLDSRVSAMLANTQLDYTPGIEDEQMMSRHNYNDVQAAIQILDQQIIAAQNTGNWIWRS